MYNPGYYLDRQSPVHKLDPRTKIITVIALSISIMQLDHTGLLIIALLLLTCSQAAHIPVVSWLKTLQPILPFFLFLFLIYIFTTPGDPLITIGPINISDQGIYMGFTQVFRFILLILTASILTMSTSSAEITMGLERLLHPVKIIGLSSQDIAMMVSLALRFVPTLIEEMNHIKEAQLSRNCNFNTRGIRGKIRNVTYLSLPLAVNLFRRCDELVNAMEARGYNKGPRTYMRDLAFAPIDFCIISIFVAGTGLCLIL
ncbi:MAG: energy-coupling factor transporter transmembrane protein EcfT [Syntrophomonadaceae bacterium]|nr:energy-coupling factor transporter transmembrane protein EcfT [Syntrophomonadaceae bacterium]